MQRRTGTKRKNAFARPIEIEFFSLVHSTRRGDAHLVQTMYTTRDEIQVRSYTQFYANVPWLSLNRGLILICCVCVHAFVGRFPVSFVEMRLHLSHFSQLVNVVCASIQCAICFSKTLALLSLSLLLTLATCPLYTQHIHTAVTLFIACRLQRKNLTRVMICM